MIISLNSYFYISYLILYGSVHDVITSWPWWLSVLNFFRKYCHHWHLKFCILRYHFMRMTTHSYEELVFLNIFYLLRYVKGMNQIDKKNFFHASLHVCTFIYIQLCHNWKVLNNANFVNMFFFCVKLDTSPLFRDW